MHPLHDLAPGQNPPELIDVLVEIPKGSRNKYELDKDTGMFRLDRTLFSPMIYPGDYGLIPQTHYDDGDPLDALIICNEPTFTGCIVAARPVGIFRMLDKGANDDKIVCVPAGNPYFGKFRDLKDVPPHYLKEVAHFFSVYKDLEGHRTLSLGWEDVGLAHEQIMHAIKLYADMHPEPAEETPEDPMDSEVSESLT
ncbi:inorganic diphosphatase [bacterium]|nr:inorganic diphosphatase [bacterium]